MAPRRDSRRASDPADEDERKGDSHVVRRLAIAALIGAVIAGSTIVQRRRVRDRIRRELIDEGIALDD